MPTRPPSVHSTASSTDSEDCDENYVAMDPNMSTDEPVCNTQLSYDYKKLHDYFFLKSQIIKTTEKKQLNVQFDFYCDMCFFLWFKSILLLYYILYIIYRDVTIPRSHTTIMP